MVSVLLVRAAHSAIIIFYLSWRLLLLLLKAILCNLSPLEWCSSNSSSSGSMALKLVRANATESEGWSSSSLHLTLF
jgi:hypothetical protein